MNARFRRGLVIGKFSPLHRGHELVLRTALARCDEVYCLSYANPELLGCSTARREAWLSELFPTVHAAVVNDQVLERIASARGERPRRLPRDDDSELEHRRFVGWLCLSLWEVSIDAVFTSELYGDDFASELGRYFAEAGVGPAQVQHVLVDLARSVVPISGTAARRDIEAAGPFLSPAVYASFVKRVCLLGGESSGKTTLAGALGRYFGAEVVPEYGRELWIERQGCLCFDDLRLIAEAQVAREEQAARRSRRPVIFGDTSPLTTHWYSQHLFGRADPALEHLASRRYDLTLLCAPDFPFVQDGTRGDAALRASQHDYYQRELERRGDPWRLVEGSIDDRLRRAAHWVEAVCGVAALAR